MGDSTTPGSDLRRSVRIGANSDVAGGSDGGGSSPEEDATTEAADAHVVQLRQDIVDLRSATKAAAHASTEAARRADNQRKADLDAYKAMRAEDAREAAADRAAFQAQTAQAAAAEREAFRQQMLTLMAHQVTPAVASPAALDRDARDGRHGSRLAGPGLEAHKPGCGGFAGETFICICASPPAASALQAGEAIMAVSTVYPNLGAVCTAYGASVAAVVARNAPLFAGVTGATDFLAGSVVAWPTRAPPRGGPQQSAGQPHPCTRLNCPCTGSYNGQPGKHCCITCRNGRACLSDIHPPGHFARRDVAGQSHPCIRHSCPCTASYNGQPGEY